MAPSSHSADSQTCLVEAQTIGAVRLLLLDDPDRRNPLSQGMVAQLRTHLRAVGDDLSIRALMLSARGPAFCTGGDVPSLDALSSAELKRLMLPSQGLIADICQLPIPVVVGMNGAAAGAGISLALAADFIVAARRARFHPAFSRIGAVPDLGVAHAFVKSMGLHRALTFFMTEESCGVEEAAKAGLVHQVVDGPDVFDAALALAARLSQGPTVSLGMTKRLVRQAADLSATALMDAESSAQAVAFSSADFKEGVRAFTERRAPRFTGH